MTPSCLAWIGLAAMGAWLPAFKSRLDTESCLCNTDTGWTFLYMMVLVSDCAGWEEALYHWPFVNLHVDLVACSSTNDDESKTQSLGATNMQIVGWGSWLSTYLRFSLHSSSRCVALAAGNSKNVLDPSISAGLTYTSCASTLSFSFGYPEPSFEGGGGVLVT